MNTETCGRGSDLLSGARESHIAQRALCDGVSINQVSQRSVQGKLFLVLNQHYLPGTMGLLSLSYPLLCPPLPCMPFYSVDAFLLVIDIFSTFFY